VSDHHDDDTSRGWALEDLDPELFRTDLEHFKWVWNETEGELVWRVSGPGDGRPAHEERVREAWGRGPRLDGGDVFGGAQHMPGDASEPGHLSIYVYCGSTVPDAIVSWFDDRFRGAEIRSS
jgi:hypothetical protein